MNEQELREILYENTIKEEIIYSSRWTLHMKSIIQIDDKYYSLDWEKGSTEYQEDIISPDNLVEVFPVKNLEVKLNTKYVSNDTKESSTLEFTNADIESYKSISNNPEVIEYGKNVLSGIDAEDVLENLNAIEKIIVNEDQLAHILAAKELFQSIRQYQRVHYE